MNPKKGSSGVLPFAEIVAMVGAILHLKTVLLMIQHKFSMAICAGAFVAVFGLPNDAQAQLRAGEETTWNNGVYNPDADQNGTIHTPDLIELLTVFGSAFEPVSCQHAEETASQKALQQEVQALEAQLAQQQSLINQIVAHLQSQASAEGPFFFDPTQGAWVATAPIVIENTMTATRVRTGRLESGSAHFGGSVVVGDAE